jgi:quercetin dioxygenase-like cupin family protein
MKRQLVKLSALALLSGGAVASSAQAPPPRPSGTTRTDLQRHDLSIPGREVLQALVSFAPGSSFPRHKHPGEEIIYVTQGTLEYEVAGKWLTVNAGEVLYVPDGVVHAARNTGKEPAAELATYVLEKGKPLTTFAE